MDRERWVERERSYAPFRTWRPSDGMLSCISTLVEQERQLGVLTHEKARVAGLLSEKDHLARELQFQLKRSERPRAARPSHPEPRRETPPAADDDAHVAAAATAASRVLVWTEAQAACPSPTSPDSVIITESTEEPSGRGGGGGGGGGGRGGGGRGSGGRSGGGRAGGSEATTTATTRVTVGGKLPAQDEASVSAQVPGVQQRFAGWRDATGPQRLAALKAENAVLLCVLRERDDALHTAQAEAERRHQHAQTVSPISRGGPCGRSSVAPGGLPISGSRPPKLADSPAFDPPGCSATCGA
jgi:hypothetical protein